MGRILVRLAVPAVMGLLHWGCCNCDDKVTAPTAVVTPTPAPTPTPTPATAACVVGPKPDVFRCANEPPPRFEAIVVRAQDQVRREHPEIFDGLGKVISQESYTGWVTTVLRSQGVCAIGGTDDEISVKDSSASSELYDLVTGARDTWTGYIFTCRPSLF